MLANTLWKECVKELTATLQEKDTNKSEQNYLQTLQMKEGENGTLRLLVPNQFVLNWVNKTCLDKIRKALTRLRSEDIELKLEVGSSSDEPLPESPIRRPFAKVDVPARLNPEQTFALFVEGKSNQMARAAALQVAKNPGKTFNPLFLYGGVGLGKTHLMHAIGNEVRKQTPAAKVTYLHSERFVAEMVAAIQLGKMNRFKEVYRSIDVLLIDDVQMFADKKQTQEEFFHTFNTLHEKGQQIVLTSDRYPKDIVGLEERLKSRFSGGLAQSIDAPELETRVAILESKAAHLGCNLPHDVAFFMAKYLKSNVRELEGALRRVAADALFTGGNISLDSAKVALSDMLASHRRQLTIENIQKTVADFYRLRVSDLTSPRRSRSIVRPRHIAMSLAKELTSHSLPEIGREFGGRDHTTVIHACRKINEIRKENPQIEKDYTLLLRTMQH